MKLPKEVINDKKGYHRSNEYVNLDISQIGIEKFKQRFPTITSLCIENNVDILYGSYVVDVEMDQQKIQQLYVENKSGRTAYIVRTIVDATGDCDIAHFALAPTNTFNQGNVLAAWYYYANEKGHHLQMLGYSDIPEDEKTGKEEESMESAKSRKNFC